MAAFENLSNAAILIFRRNFGSSSLPLFCGKAHMPECLFNKVSDLLPEILLILRVHHGYFSGFNLTFQTWFISFPNETKAKLILNVAYHGWETKTIFNSRSPKKVLYGIFLLFYFTEKTNCIKELCQKSFVNILNYIMQNSAYT